MIHAAIIVLLAQSVPPGLGTQPGGLDGGEPIGSAFNRCGNCHDRLSTDPGVAPYAPFDTWASSMMANSVRDPLFQAALDVANQDVPGIGSWCLRCHAPQAYVRGHTTPPDGGAFDALDSEGVTCDVCHRATVNPDSGTAVIGNAQLFFDPSSTRFGPYAATTSSDHAGTDGGLIGSSEVCGACHQLANPMTPWRNVTDAGILGPGFPLDTTYEEWKASQYAQPGPTFKSCADCHMPRVATPDGGVPVAKFGPLRDSPRRHTFVGGNLWGLSAVQASDPSTALLIDQFTETKRMTRELLAQAAELTVTTAPTAVAGGTLDIRVRVRNKTGHKLPTGFAEGRRLFLQMTLEHKVHTGGFDGGTLDDDGWLRIYRADHGSYDAGGIDDRIALQEVRVLDTRLLPTGFKAAPGAAVLPEPDVLYRLGDGGYVDYDELVWDVDVPSAAEAGETFDIRVSLFYQSTTPGYVHSLANANRTTDAGRRLLDIWRATGESTPVEMTHTDVSVPMRAPSGAGGGMQSGTGGSGGAGGSAGSGGGTGGGGTPKGSGCGCDASFGPGALLLALALLRRRSGAKARQA